MRKPRKAKIKFAAPFPAIFTAFFCIFAIGGISAVGGRILSSSQLSPPQGAENSVVIVTAEVEEEVPFFLLLLPHGSQSRGYNKAGTVTHGGTGFALEGRIYTCEHVIHGAKRITVTLRTGTIEEAKLLRSEKESDLAELEIAKMPPSLHLRSYAPQLLEKIWQIGNPGELKFVVTTGRFLSFAGHENIFIIDTYFGNSGSPLMDNYGRVIGMTHNIIPGTRFTGGGTLQELQNFTHPDRPR